MIKEIYRKLRFYFRMRKIASSALLADFGISLDGKSQNKHNLSFFLLVKDGARYLNEWLGYHYSIGVEHFYIVNDMSADNIKEVLEPWVKLGIVSVADFRVNGMQSEIYTYFSRKLALETKWLGFLDLDEFLVVKGSENAVLWLNSFPETTSVVEINWCCFGSSGLEKYENIFVTKRFKKYSSIDFEPNIQVKSIVKPGKNYIFPNPHSVFHSVDNIRNSNGELLSEDFFQRKPVWDKAWINHYFCLSKEEFAKKIKRGRATSKKGIRTWEDFEWHDTNECMGDKSLETAEKQINEVLKKLCVFLIFAVVLSFANGWVHYSGQNEVRDVALTDNGTLWAALAWGLQERLPNKRENTYMTGNNNLNVADFVQVFALPGSDIIAISKNGTLVRKNKNSNNFETINSSFVEKQRIVLQGKGKKTENILILPFDNAMAFFDYEQRRSVITLTQIGTSSLDKYAINRVAVKNDSIWVELWNDSETLVWKRCIDWKNIHEDRRLAEPISWNAANKIPFEEEPKPKYIVKDSGFPMKRVMAISVLSGEWAAAWGNDYSDFSIMENERWGGAFGYGRKTDFTQKSLAVLPNKKFAVGMFGLGVRTFNGSTLISEFNSLNSGDECPTKYADNNTEGWTLTLGLVAAPEFSGYIFSYVSEINYGVGFINNEGKAVCYKSSKASSDAGFPVTAKKNEMGEWEIYVAWKSSFRSNAGGVDFYKVSNPQNWTLEFQKTWALPFGSPVDFAFDSRGVLWAVSSSKIFYLDKNENEWKEPSYIRGFSGAVISSLETDARNGLWVGTIGSGAYSFSQIDNSPDSLSAKQYRIKDGLLNETIHDVAIDTIKGRVYFAHDLGLSVYHTAAVRNGQDYMRDGAPKTIAYPNPFRPALHDFVRIDYINEKSSVYILDSSGKRVRFYSGGSLKGGAVLWDGKNESGKLVAPGLYHYIAADGKNTVKGKILLER